MDYSHNIYHWSLLFFVTYASAFMATVPPGLLNMNAAKTSVSTGKKDGVTFSLGVSTMVLFQALIAVNISKILHQKPEVVTTLTEIALVIFLVLAVYFFIKKETEVSPRKSIKKWAEGKPFLKGLMLAAINLLSVPYYSTLNVMWKKAGWINFEYIDVAIFVTASSLGTFSVLYLYVFYFNKLDAKKGRFAKNSNKILGVLMLLLASLCAVRIYHW